MRRTHSQSENYHANPTFSREILFAWFQSQLATRGERCVFKLRFSTALVSSLADFATEIHFSREKTGHVNAPSNQRSWFQFLSSIE